MWQKQAAFAAAWYVLTQIGETFVYMGNTKFSFLQYPCEFYRQQTKIEVIKDPSKLLKSNGKKLWE